MMTSVAWRVIRPVTLLYRTRSAAWSHSIGLHHHCSHDQGWSTVCGVCRLHCSRLLARYTDLNGNCSTYQARVPLIDTVALSCVCALKTHEPSCTDGPTTSSFTLEAHGPHKTVQHVTASERSLAAGRVRSRETRDNTGALLSEEAGSRAAEHMAVPEPSSVGRRGLKLRDM
jgi:hypothetical protein